MKTIIIGGVAAGMTAAAKLKRLLPDQHIVVYEKGFDLSYSGCGMPYFLGDVVTDESKLIARNVQDFKNDGIDVLVGHEVIALNHELKRVEIKHLLTQKTFVDFYDTLIIATGTKAKRSNVSGSNLKRVYVLNQLYDMRLIKDEVIKGRRVAIIGGGYIGIELAENLRHKGLDVDIIQRGSHILTVFDQDVSVKAVDVLNDLGVSVHVNETLKSYEQLPSGVRVVTSMRTLDVDFVVECIGVTPNTEFLKDTGIALSSNGAIVINSKCMTSLTGVYAAGDCVSYHHIIKQVDAYVPLGTHANKTGRIVAENIAHLNVSFNGIVGSNIIKIGALAFAKTGLGIDEATALGLSCAFVDITAKHQTSYYPGATDLFVRLVFETHSGVLKGAQLVGEHGVSDRINIMALAITKSLTAREFAQLDFAYAPPFSPVWDPLLVAANQIKVVDGQ